MPAPANLVQSLEALLARGDFVVPPYPAAALRLRRLIESGNFGLSEVAEAAGSDSALAAALLRLANSAAARGTGAPITTLGRAVHRLGARSISTLALGATIGVSALIHGPLVDVKYRVWRRSLSCALVCQYLASGRSVDADEAFLAGLLYGFGRSVAVGCLERALPKLPISGARPLLEWLQALEPHRHTLARKVAEHWALPIEIVQALGGSSSSARGSFGELVELADRVAGALDVGASAEQAANEVRLPARETRGLAEFIQSLPQTLEAFIDTPDAAPRAPQQSAVSKPPTSLSGEPRPLGVTVVDLKNRKTPRALQALAVTADGLCFASEQPMQEGCVARLAVGSAPGLVEGWFSVTLCVRERERYRVEVKAFAPSRELREQLNELWLSARR